MSTFTTSARARRHRRARALALQAEASKADKTKSNKVQLKKSVYVAATLERPDSFETPSGYDYSMRRLYLDQKNNLCADAHCGDDVFICTNAELTTFSEFLTQLVAQLQQPSVQGK